MLPGQGTATAYRVSRATPTLYPACDGVSQRDIMFMLTLCITHTVPPIRMIAATAV